MLRTHPTPKSTSAVSRCILFALCATILVLLAAASEAQQVRLPSGKGQYAELSSDGPQTHKGDVFIADKNVDLLYAGMRLRADHVEYNDTTHDSLARGHVQFDFENEHLEADEARYNFTTGAGTFINVRGNIRILRRPNPMVLVSANPLYFEARRVERYGDNMFVVHQAWITVCDQQRPTWQMYAPRAKIHLNKTVALVSANFRLFRVPLIWLPYATAPARQKIRQSGFLLPDLGNSSIKGYIFG